MDKEGSMGVDREHELRGERAETDPSKGDADRARVNLRFLELKNEILDFAKAGPEEYSELTELISQLRSDERHSFLEQEVIRELSPKSKRLTDDQLATAFGVTKRTLYNWRHSEWYRNSIERVRREWRSKLDVFPFFHPYGIAAEIAEVLYDDEVSHPDRLKAVGMAATLLPSLIPADMRQEEEDAPGALIEEVRRILKQKRKERREALEAQARKDKE